MENKTDLAVELFAVDDLSIEDLPESGAAGWSTGACVSSGGTFGGTFGSFGSLSSYNT